MKNHMKPLKFAHLLTMLAVATLGGLPSARAATAPPESGVLLDTTQGGEFKSEGATAEIVEENGAKVLKAAFPEGKGYPAFAFPLPAGGWDLSKYSGVQVDVTNTSAGPIKIALRVDNPGDWKKQPWNTEAVTLKAGETKTIKVSFGKSYGGTPGYALDPSKISALKMFAENPQQPVVVQLKNLKAFGTASSTPAPAATTSTPATTSATTSSAPKVLLDMGEGSEKRLTPSSEQVVVMRSTDPAAPGLIVTIQPGKEGYPGVSLTPEGGAWDLSAFGHVEARVVNTGEKPLSLSMAVDNEPDGGHRNTESATIKPGQTGTVKVIFGYQYGGKPGYPLKPAEVQNLLLFTGKGNDVRSFRIESIHASGPAGEQPPFDPNSIRIEPKNGVILGTGVAVEPAQLTTKNGAQATANGSEIRAVFAPAKADQWISFKPAQGRWNLRDYLEVKVALRNDGQSEVTPRVRLESNGGPSASVKAVAPLAPGAKTELTIPFIPATPINLSEKTSENRLTSNAVSAVVVAADKAGAEQTIVIESIQASMPPVQMPDWLGKRPPVEGDWVKTLDDNFDGNAIDQTVWNLTGDNYYDKRTHWSKDNVIVEDGVAKLRYTKMRGHHNDDPKGAETDYAAGFLDTYDKWAQRYGYFEARMKLPKAPGLWPAFWGMPDRGREAGIWWKRKDTAFGGMEFDIMEHLTGWGPNRFNIAQHWDGYKKDHKSNGSDKVYVQPDKDGFITAGLLWTPGSAIYYCNGREVLRWENERVTAIPSFLMFTLPSGGWDNSPFDETKLPADFVIDYVRVWQRKDLASAADGKKPPLPAPPPAPPAQ
jgi:beta-glucanase (GH16 family)